MFLFILLSASLQNNNATMLLTKDDIAMNLGVTKSQVESNNNNPYICQQADHMAMMQETNQYKEYVSMEQYIAVIEQIKKTEEENEQLKKYLKVALLPVARAGFVDFLAKTVSILKKHGVKPQSGYRENIDRGIAEELAKQIKKHSSIAIDTLISASELKSNSEYLFKGETPFIHYAVKFGLEHSVNQLIVDGADVNIQNNNNTTPLHLAAFNGHKEIVELLIGAGAYINRTNTNGTSPLHFAAYRGHEEIVQLLIDYGAYIDIPNNNWQTPLIWAAYNGHEKIVLALIGAGANLDIQTTNGNTPLHLATFRGHKEIVELLIVSGANINIANNNGGFPINLVVQK